MAGKQTDQAFEAAVQELYKKHGIKAATLSYLGDTMAGSLLYQLEVEPKEERDFLTRVEKMLEAVSTNLHKRLVDLGPDMEGTSPMEGGCPDQSMGREDAKRAAYWRKNGTCSYCGSMNPTEVLELLDDKKAVVSRAIGKNYKVYLELLDDKGNRTGQHKVYLWHFSTEQLDLLNALANPKK